MVKKLGRIVKTRFFEYKILEDHPYGMIEICTKYKERINIPIILSEYAKKKITRKWLNEKIKIALSKLYKSQINSHLQEIEKLKIRISEIENNE